MKNSVLLLLAARWEKDADTPAPRVPCVPGSVRNIDEIVADSKSAAQRECKRECAYTLRMLVDLLGGDDA